MQHKVFRWRLLTFSLLLIALLQVMIFVFFQIADQSISTEHPSGIIPLNILFYSVMLVTSIFHPFIMRKCSLQFALLAGLFCDLLGVSFVWINEAVGGTFVLVVLGFLFAGISIVSVINCLITYLVIEFPRSLGFAMLVLFIFANIGTLIDTLIYDLLADRNFYPIFCAILIGLLLLAMYFVYTKFFNPVVPAHLTHLRRSSLLWKELNYRMGLFIAMILLYGIVESILSVWGGIYLLKFVTAVQAELAVVLFWACMILGQFLLLAPIYFFSARKIFSLLLIYTIAVMAFLSEQTQAMWLLAGYIGAGLGCAIIFPSLLSFFEKEVLITCAVSKIQSPIPFVEMGISLMVGGYFAGVGIVSLFVLKHQNYPELFTQSTFYWGALLLAMIAITSTYLNWSSASLRK